MSQPAVVVAPLGEQGRSELIGAVGAEHAGTIAELLQAQAEAWAREVGDGDPRVLEPSADVVDEVARQAGESDHPVAVIWPTLARLRPDLGPAVVDDLAAGCDVIFGPLVDQGLYLLAFRRMLPLVADLLQGGLTPDGFAAALALAAESGLELGYLRPERSLASRDGVALALADPLTPENLSELLQNPA